MNKKNTINHLSIILDGNKRWAKKNYLSTEEAYKAGIDNVVKISEHLIEKKIKYFSVFTMSTENIKRNSAKMIFNSIYDKFSFFLNKIVKEKFIKIKVIGERENLPEKLKELIIQAENQSSKNKHLTLILAFNYGFKSEIISVFKQGIEKFNKQNKINFNKDIDNLFYLRDVPDPDLLIRTGGFKRLSNFLMYNLCYTELFFTETLWPDFAKNELEDIITNFSKIKRNYGL